MFMIILQIGSLPNIYVLDTPGVLPPQIDDVEVCTKLALTGTIIMDALFLFLGSKLVM
jgi:ribosome biogenesis GTPase A